MSVPFLQRSHAFAAQSLHRAGLTVSQIPQAVQIARETVEQWLQKELESGNTHEALQVLKGHVQEKGAQMLFDKLKDMLLVRLVLHLGIKSALATNIVTLLLPFVLKRVYDLARQNPKMQAWWREQEWRQHMPTMEKVRNIIKEVGQNLKPASRKTTSTDQALFI
ncbi:hypothetical protein EFA69_17085 [Rufibacter immobilis]|uniref:Uncharacterized protein n=1 Tax=Rufibacter immobilis TaxID=1348778 RepID=A0A3M9MRI8_9BACT|nr:hypothetical protein [Rufibacter immobilis]RNI27817.1 hypothetical protein EFA69_17085 [Rufibacter immobilis]